MPPAYQTSRMVMDCVLIPSPPYPPSVSAVNLPSYNTSSDLLAHDSPEVARRVLRPRYPVLDSSSLPCPSSPSDDSDRDASCLEYSDSASESDTGDSQASSLPPSQLLARKRREKGHSSEQASPKKRFRMHASRGYPVELGGSSGTFSSDFRSSVPYCEQESHIDPSKGCRSIPITHCAILYKLRMYFGPHGFVCEKCGQIYPPRYLHSHIRSKNHAKDLDVPSGGKRKKEVYRVIVSHLLNSHGTQEDTVFQLPQTLPDAIPGLSPTLSYKCPICPARWFQWHSFRSHYREEHRDASCPDKQTIQARYIIRPYRLGVLDGAGGRSELSNTVILLPEDWTPRNSPFQCVQPSVPRERPPVPAGAPHLVTLGWPEYLQSLKVTDVRRSVELVEMPTEKDLATFPLRRAALERGIHRLSKFLTRYLKDANDFLETCHPSVRQSIIAGTKAHFRKLSEKTYIQYRRIMMKTLCLLLRFRYFSRLKGQPLGSFSVVSSKQQARATEKLYQHLIASATGEDDDALNRLVHDLLVTLVHHEIHGTGKMECPTDQSLFLLSIKVSTQGTLQFRTANQLTHDCAVLQYWFFSIIVHLARLEANGQDGFFFFRNDTSDSRQMPREELLTDQSDEDALTSVQGFSCAADDSDDDREDPMAEEELEGLEMLSEGEQVPATNILRIIHREKEKWLRAIPGCDYFTPYDRFKSTWFGVAPAAFKESSAIGHGFQPDGSTVVVDAIGESHRINMVDIGSEARRIMLEIDSLLKKSLPEGTKDLLASVTDLSELSDDLKDASSIFEQNANLFEPVIADVAKALSPSFSSEERLRTWLDNNDQILSRFMVAIALTCGVPPRAFQFASLQFSQCPKTGTSRGLFLIDGNLAIAKPAAKQSSRTRQDCLWFLPSALSASLMFYLGILRPIVIRALVLLRKEVVPQKIYIFCCTFPRIGNSYSWTGEEVAEIFENHTRRLKINLSVGLIRQLYTAFFRQYFPDLCVGGVQEDSLVDRQGQHRFYTGQRHYGTIITSVPRALGIDLTEARKMGAMSHLLHVAFGFRPADDHWKLLLERSHILPGLQHQAYALDTARILVVSEYKISSAGAGPRLAIKARALLNDHPYFQLPQKHDEQFGDTVLDQVLHALLFGEAGPGPFDQTPPGGYHVSDVAHAISLIIQAAEEWTDGNYRQISRKSDLSAEEHFKGLQRLAEERLEKAKDQWPEEWYRLSGRVRTFHPQKHARIWSLRGLPQAAD